MPMPKKRHWYTKKNTPNKRHWYRDKYAHETTHTGTNMLKKPHTCREKGAQEMALIQKKNAQEMNNTQTKIKCPRNDPRIKTEYKRVLTSFYIYFLHRAIQHEQNTRKHKVTEDIAAAHYRS